MAVWFIVVVFYCSEYIVLSTQSPDILLILQQGISGCGLLFSSIHVFDSLQAQIQCTAKKQEPYGHNHNRKYTVKE